MKMSKIKAITVLAVMAVLSGGCGAAPYTLTESEENLIVHYAAHVVAKFNTDQEKGLTYVKPDAEEETESETEERAPETEGAQGLPAAPQGGAEAEAVPGEPAVSLGDIFGNGNLSISCTNARVTPHYAENSYYSVDAEPGKTYLVLDFEITNSGPQEETIDCLARKPYFQVEIEGGRKITSELTLLMEDFSAYQAEIPAGQTQYAVLLFQIPDTYTEVPDFTLSISVDEETHQIAL